jgi:hypothetical protein
MPDSILVVALYASAIAATSTGVAMAMIDFLRRSHPNHAMSIADARLEYDRFVATQSPAVDQAQLSGNKHQAMDAGHQASNATGWSRWPRDP